MREGTVEEYMTTQHNLKTCVVGKLVVRIQRKGTRRWITSWWIEDGTRKRVIWTWRVDRIGMVVLGTPAKDVKEEEQHEDFHEEKISQEHSSDFFEDELLVVIQCATRKSQYIAIRKLRISLGQRLKVAYAITHITILEKLVANVPFWGDAK